MPQNLFAACRTNGALVAKRIRLDQAVQQQIETIFNQQEADFRDGITSEVDFDGSWTPDDDEFLTIDVPQEAAIFADTLNANPVAIPDIDTANFEAEGIKGIFTGGAVNGAVKVLVQRFSPPANLEPPVLAFASWQCLPSPFRSSLFARHRTHLHHRGRKDQVSEFPQAPRRHQPA